MRSLLWSVTLLLPVLSCASPVAEHAAKLAVDGGVAHDHPAAAKRPTVLKEHGHERTDNYYWLNERENPEVIEYLEQENAYVASKMQPTAGLQSVLFDEMVGRIKQDDSTVPRRDGDFYYYTRYREGGEYSIFCRKPVRSRVAANVEQVLLDGNALAVGQDYFSLGRTSVSTDHERLAYAVDTVGRRRYTIYFKDLNTGATLADSIPDVTGNMVWANDNETLFYSKQDATTLRANQIFRHTLGTETAQDVLVFEERDETFRCFVWKTKSKDFLMIESSQTLSTEQRFLDANNPTGEFQVLAARERNLEYEVEHFGEYFYLVTNWDAPNFRLMRTPITATSREHWTEVIPHRADVLLQEIEPFRDFYALTERSGGLSQIRIRRWDGGAEHTLDFGEPAYTARLSDNIELDTEMLRYRYSSMTTPNSVFDYNMVTRKRELRKQDEVLGGFNSANYTTERLMATARDGTSVPISLVYRKGFERNGKSPLLLYGYGSYGASMDASFGSSQISLIDRGFVYAIAHVRGGEEMGRQWYEDGKLLKKVNTFTDFIDCAEFLVKTKVADPERLYAMGGSAGGLLMGAVINMRPDLFDGVVAAVPFVDVVTTMLDDSIPLTVAEYDEWGNPHDKQYYEYMLSYSPYDNVRALDYPNLLVTTGLHDSQVQYFEPAKWVAKLREFWRSDNLLLLQTNMEAGHGGASGRFRRLHETALQFAFILHLAGVGASPAN